MRYATFLYLPSLLFLGSIMAGCRPGTPVPPRIPPSVVIAEAQSREVQSFIETTGHADANQFVKIPARVSGYLQEIRYKSGDMVTAGTPLFLIEPGQYQAQVDAAEANLAAAKAQLELAEANLSRTKDLFAQNALTRADLDTDTAKRNVAAASVLQMEAALKTAKIDLAYTDVRSPIFGKVDRNSFDIGNMVGPEGPNNILTTVARLHPITITFEISDTQFNDVRQEARKDPSSETKALIEKIEQIEHEINKEADSGAVAVNEPSKTSNLNVLDRFHLPFEVGIIKGNAPNIGEYPFKGVLTMASNVIDRSTGTILLQGSVPNENYDIYPGQICRLRVPLWKIPDAVVVEEEAIASDLNRKYMFVVDEKNIVKRRNVEIGDLQPDNMCVITKGLKAGEKYVKIGLQKVHDGDEVKPVKEGGAP